MADERAMREIRVQVPARPQERREMAHMKLSALWKLCKSEKTMTIYQEEEGCRQFLQVGGGIYPLKGLPWLDKEGLLTMLDVTEDKRDEYDVHTVSMTEDIERYVQDNEGSDHMAVAEACTIGADEMVMRPIRTQYGMVLINAEALKPVEDTKRTHELYVRKIGENPWILVKNGFELVASIGRVKSRNINVADVLKEVATHIIGEDAAETAEEQKRDGEQQHI